MKRLFFLTAVFFLALDGAFSQAKRGGALEFYESGVKNQRQGDMFKAAEDFQQAVQMNPSYADAWFSLAEVAYSQGEYSLCLDYLESAETFAKERVEILNLRGMCCISLGDFDSAEQIFQKIISEHPNNVEARFGLAEIQLFSGSYNNAQDYYLEALKRQGGNKKALLSLAVLSFEQKNYAAAEKYIRQALKYHSGEADVHYLAAYLEAENGRLKEAERRARAAVQIDGNCTDAYILLAGILYEQKRFDEVADICDYMISKNRNNVRAWYLKGLSCAGKGDVNGAVETWSAAVKIDENDEILRAALETVISENFPLEDEGRRVWAEYHVQKARAYSKLFKGDEARYEYRRALKLDPNNLTARGEYAELLRKSGFNEQYLNQMKFIRRQSGGSIPAATQDTIEAYESLMKYSLEKKWNVDTFYLDKTRWNIGLYYEKSPVQLLHCDSEKIAAALLESSFTDTSSSSVSVEKSGTSGFSDAFSSARKKKQDYFIILKFDESERDVSLSGTVYNGRNGIKIDEISLFRTGNDKFASVIRGFKRNVLELLPVKGTVLKLNGDEVLVDLGKTENISAGTTLSVVKKGGVRTNDKEKGIQFDEKQLLGEIKITAAGEEISEGILTQRFFYDSVNPGDEIVIKDEVRPENSPENQNADTEIASGTEKFDLSAKTLDLIRIPSFIDVIRNIRP